MTARATERQAEAARLTLEIMSVLSRIADSRPSLPDHFNAPPFSMEFCRKAKTALLMMQAESQSAGASDG
jgi:hypothetical protein